MLRILVVTSIATLLQGCATTHPGKETVAKQKAIVVSVQEKIELSDDYYRFLEFTIENKTSEWKDVKFNSVQWSGKPSEILVNEKLSSWIEGAELKLQKEQYNTAMMLGTIGAVGAVAAIGSNDKTIQTTGAVAAVGAVSASSAISIANNQNAANSGQRGLNNTVNVPQNHIFAPVKVPPGSYVRRWIVIGNPVIKTTSSKFTLNSLATIKDDIKSMEDEFIATFTAY
jgi:hypothetical protein